MTVSVKHMFPNIHKHWSLKMLDGALEDQPEYNGFTDFCDTFQIMHGDDSDDEGQEVIGEFKVNTGVLNRF